MTNWLRKLLQQLRGDKNIIGGDSKKVPTFETEKISVKLLCESCKEEYCWIDITNGDFFKSIGVHVLCDKCYKLKTRMMV